MLQLELWQNVTAYQILPDVTLVSPPDSQRFLTDLSSISFNTSEATAWVSIGALSLLMVATGLYLFNYYNQSARSDNVPQYDPFGNYNPEFGYKRR